MRLVRAGFVRKLSSEPGPIHSSSSEPVPPTQANHGPTHPPTHPFIHPFTRPLTHPLGLVMLILFSMLEILLTAAK